LGDKLVDWRVKKKSRTPIFSSTKEYKKSTPSKTKSWTSATLSSTWKYTAKSSALSENKISNITSKTFSSQTSMSDLWAIWFNKQEKTHKPTSTFKNSSSFPSSRQPWGPKQIQLHLSSFKKSRLSLEKET
jgi:hypothetical protein